MDYAQKIKDLGVSIKAEFVPHSQSRNKDNSPCLNWKVTLFNGDRAILTTDYSAGIGHCPSYKAFKKETYEYQRAISLETEGGFAARAYPWGLSVDKSKPILPKAEDVIYSLLSDASCLNYSSFEDWADEYGYDHDSRKALAIYHECLDIALKLRNGLGEGKMKALGDILSDY